MNESRILSQHSEHFCVQHEKASDTISSNKIGTACDLCDELENKYCTNSGLSVAEIKQDGDKYGNLSLMAGWSSFNNRKTRQFEPAMELVTHTTKCCFSCRFLFLFPNRMNVSQAIFEWFQTSYRPWFLMKEAYEIFRCVIMSSLCNATAKIMAKSHDAIGIFLSTYSLAGRS